MEIAKLALEYVKAFLVWPMVAIIVLVVLRKQIVALLDLVRSLTSRITRVNAFGVSAELQEQLLKEAIPTQHQAAPSTDIGLSVSSGGYSTDYHAIFLVAGLSNPTDQADQVVDWKLTFPDLGIELEPTSPPPNLLGGVPWWPSPQVELAPNKLVRGSLYFRGRGALAYQLPDEPLRGKITATTLHGKSLSDKVDIFRLATLNARAVSANVEPAGPGH